MYNKKDTQYDFTNTKPGKRWDYRLGTVSSECHWGFKAGFKGAPNLTLVPSKPQKKYSVNKNTSPRDKCTTSS